MSVQSPTRKQLPTWRDRVALSRPIIAVGTSVTLIALALRSRRRRPWLAMIAVPLEMSATLSVGLWWTWPALIFSTWWWANSEWRWSWVVGVEAGIVGTEWAYGGAVALGDFPDSRPLVGSIWIACALALAAVSARNRWGGRLLFQPTRD